MSVGEVVGDFRGVRRVISNLRGVYRDWTPLVTIKGTGISNQKTLLQYLLHIHTSHLGVLRKLLNSIKHNDFSEGNIVTSRYVGGLL